MGLIFLIRESDEKNLAILQLDGDLGIGERQDFLLGLDKLVRTKRKRIVIDFSKIPTMSSLFIGTLIDFGGRASETEQDVAVLMRPRMAEECRLSGAEKTLQIVELHAKSSWVH